MAVDEKVIDKIRKMLALAGNNPNEHEAAVAAAKAQELMLEYDLTVEAVSTKTDRRLTGIERGERREMRKRGKPGTWKFALFSVIGSTSGCWVYGGEHSAYLIGRAQDVSKRSPAVPVEDTRTPDEKKRDEERDRKYRERQERKERTARRNRDRATDWEAYEVGRETGKNIVIRRGVKAGETPEERRALR